MTPSFATISVHSFVTSVGAYVGLASILAVALLVLLYFAHARETATLRDRLDEAQQRIGGLEARIGQLMHAQAAGARRVPGPAPVAPPPVRPGAVQTGAVRRVPSPATAAAVATGAGLAAAAVARDRQAPGVTWAPAGTAAPALASATKLIPDPASAGSGNPDDTLFVPAAAVAAATKAATNGQTAAKPTEAVSAATQAMPVAAAAARTPSATPRGPVASPPRVQIASEAAGAAGAATAAGAAAAAGASTGATSGRRVRRIGGNKSEAAAPVLPPSFIDEDGGGRGRFAGRVLPLLIGGVALAVIIAGLIVITNANNGSTTGNVPHNNTSNQTGAGLHKQQTAAQAFHAGNETVAVLNGTAQSGLAGDVGNKLAGKGFKKGNITNGASQTQALTFVYYVPGAASRANKVAARHVAQALGLSPARVRRAGHSVQQSCGISPTGTSLGACSANVIVSVGQDRVNLASGSSG
jgi:hypothetical protein